MASQQLKLRHNRQLANNGFTKWSRLDVDHCWRVLLNIDLDKLCYRLHDVKLLHGHGCSCFWQKSSQRHGMYDVDLKYQRWKFDERTHGLLEQMMHRQRGVTLVELMVVTAVAAVLLMAVVPSFSDLLVRKRVEGVLSQLNTDLQFARSEAAQRNSNVRMTFGPNCYVIHTVGSIDTNCTQSTVSIGTGALQIKLVQMDAASTVSLSTSNALTYLMFDSVRGMATWDGTGTPPWPASITSSAGSWQLRTSVTAMGRSQICSPNSSISGYPACS